MLPLTANKKRVQTEIGLYPLCFARDGGRF